MIDESAARRTPAVAGRRASRSETNATRAGRGAVVRAAQRDLEGEQMIGVESGPDMGELDHAVEHQPGGGEQDDGQRDLCDHERVACAPGRPGNRASGRLQQVDQAALRSVRRDDNAEEQAEDAGDCRGEHGDTRVDRRSGSPPAASSQTAAAPRAAPSRRAAARPARRATRTPAIPRPPATATVRGSRRAPSAPRSRGGGSRPAPATASRRSRRRPAAAGRRCRRSAAARA